MPALSIPAELLDRLPPHLARALPPSIERILAEPDILGVVWTGSGSRGEADEYSDLDFYVVTAASFRQRASWVIEGAPVEVFFNPVRRVRRYFTQEDASTLWMLAQGLAVVPHSEVEVLQQEARQVLARGPRERARAELDWDRHAAIDAVWEARSAVGTPSHALLALRYVLTFLYRSRRWWDVKPKMVLTDLAARDPALADLLRAVLKADDAKRQAALEALAEAVVGPLQYVEWASEPQEA